MALLFMEGFRWTAVPADLAAGERWTQADGGGNGSIIAGNVTGTNAYRSFSAGNGLAGLVRPHGVDTTTNKLVVGFRYRAATPTAGAQQIMQIYQGVSIRATLWQRVDGKIGYGFGEASQNFQTTTTIDGNWHYIEVEITADASGTPTVGQVRIFIDGAENASGTIQTFSTNTSSENIVFKSQSLAAGNHDYMDIYIADNTAGQITAPVGDVQVVTAVPSADDFKEWDEPVVGDHFEKVNELNVANASLGSDGDFIQTVNGTPKEDRFTVAFPDLALNVGDTIYGAQVAAVMGDTTTAAPDIEIGVESGVANRDISAAKQLPDGSYGAFYHMVEDDPQTAGAWSVANAQAVEILLKTV